MGQPIEHILTAIDVGSAKTCALVAEITESGLRYRSHGIVDSLGSRKGVIVDLEKAISSIQRAVEEAEDGIGEPIERAIVLGSSGMILPEDLPETLHETPAQSMRSSTYHEAVRQLKRQLILTAMDQSEGKITEAARLLGVHSNYLHRLIRNLDLRLTLRKRNKA